MSSLTRVTEEQFNEFIRDLGHDFEVGVEGSFTKYYLPDFSRLIGYRFDRDFTVDPEFYIRDAD